MPEVTPLATAYAPEEGNVPPQMQMQMQQGYPAMPGRGGEGGPLTIPERGGGGGGGGGGGPGPMGMQQQLQGQLPFPQMKGDEGINIGADGMSMSIDELTAQKRQQAQQAQYMQQQAYLRQQQQGQMQQQMAREALERRMATIAKEELKQQALGYIAIGVCIVLGTAMFMRPPATH